MDPDPLGVCAWCGQEGPHHYYASCFDAGRTKGSCDYCEDTTVEIAAITESTYDLDDVIADQTIESMYDDMDLDNAIFRAERYGEPIPGAGTPECPHLSVVDATGYPDDHAGHCTVYAVCEDCDEELGQTGTDSVL